MKIRYTSTTYAIRMTVYGPELDASIFPKSYKVYVSHLTLCKARRTFRGVRTVSIAAQIESDGVNKGNNENGIKRLEKFLKKCKQVYGNVTMIKETSFANDVELPDSLKEIINQ